MRLFIATMLWGACKPAPTTLAVDVSLQAGESQPATLTVSVFDRHGARVVDRLLPPGRLPGTLVVTGLDPLTQTLRIVVHGDDLVGAAAAQTQPHQQVRVGIALASGVSDRDGDGVPDALDDCPDDADPDQGDAAGDGVGDACAGADLETHTDDLALPDDLATPADDLTSPAANDLADGASVDLVAPGCPGAFCEDFESGALDSARWSSDKVGATVAVEPDRPHRGASSLHVHANAGPAGQDIYGDIREANSLAAGQPPLLAVRAYAWLAPAPPTLTLVKVVQKMAPYDDLELRVDNGKLSLWNGVTRQYMTGQTVPPSQWVCLEWWIFSLGEMRVFADGAEITALHVAQSTTPATPLAEVGFGINIFQPAQPVAAYDLWLDDIIVDTGPVGCGL